MSSDTIRRQMGVGPSAPSGADDDGGLPWLEPAPDPDRGSLSFKSLAIIGTIFLLVFIALMAVFYNRIAGSGPNGTGLGDGSPTLIAAPAGPFKITPKQDAMANDTYRDDDQMDTPRFASGSEQPLTGAEQLEQVANSGVGGAIELGTPDAPIGGYIRPTAPQPPIPPQPSVTSPEPAVVAVTPPKLEPAKRAPVVAAPAPQPATQTQTASTGGYLLQLGAFSSREGAMNGWQQFSQKYPGSLSGLSPDLQAFQNSSNKTLYRLRAAGLTSRSRADARCAALKAANQACFVVSP